MPNQSLVIAEEWQRDIEAEVSDMTIIEFADEYLFGIWLLIKQTLKKLPPAQRIAVYIVSSLAGGALIIIAIRSGNVGIGLIIGALLMALIIFVSRV